MFLNKTYLQKYCCQNIVLYTYTEILSYFLMASLNINSLYTNIPVDKCLKYSAGHKNFLK